MTATPSRIQVGIGIDVHPEPQPIEIVSGALHVLILGDFGGSRPVAERTVIRLDVDGIDAAIAAVAPTLQLTLDPSEGPDTLRFRELDDFHPDRLLVLAPLLARLRELRAEVARSRPAAPVESAQGHASLLDQIIDMEQPAAPRASDDLDEFVRRAVRPVLSSELSSEQQAIVNKVDEAIIASLRVLLHDARFQALEATWRGADFFLRRSATGDASHIALTHLTAAELTTAVRNSEPAFRDVMLHHDGTPRWSLVICAHAYSSGDVGLLGELAAFAMATRTPLLVAADSSLVGATTFASGADVDEWDRASITGWDALRRTPSARYLAVATPRFLLRVPYGADTDSIDAMAFEEFGDGAIPHEHFLWGNPAYLAALVATQAVERGEAARTHGTIGGLPFHTTKVDGLPEAKPCAEALMSQRTVMHVLELGLTPLVSEKDGDSVRVPRMQSIALPSAPLVIQPIGAES